MEEAKAAAYEARIAALEAEVARLGGRAAEILPPAPNLRGGALDACAEAICALDAESIERYSRQMLVSGFGAHAQETLSALRVLIVGAGGLGCPVALYLAAAGVGHLSVVDDDAVEASNLPRQIGHAESRVGWPKARSLCSALGGLAARATCAAHEARFSAANGLALARAHDIVVDASDNPATRYLVSDACVLARRPLVFGAALGLDGQAAVFNYGASSPCYRCIYPEPPPPAVVTSCADAGVLGPIAGIVGCVMALEVLKIAAAARCPSAAAGAEGAPAAGEAARPPLPSCSAPHEQEPRKPAPPLPLHASLAGRLFVLDGADMRSRLVRLRGPRADCIACGSSGGGAGGGIASAPCESSADGAGGSRLRIETLADSAAWLASRGLRAVEGGGGGSAPACPLAPPTPQMHAEASAARGELGGGDSDRDLVVSPLRLAHARRGAAACSRCESLEARAVVGEGAAVVGEGAASAATAACACDDRSSRPPPAVVIIDVRSSEQFSICALRGSVHIPLPALQRDAHAALAAAGLALPLRLAGGAVCSGAGIGGCEERAAAPAPRVFVVCRRGVDSLIAAQLLRALGVAGASSVEGGLDAWSRLIDPCFPRY